MEIEQLLNDGEEARPVKGFEGDYLVTNHGRVISLKGARPRVLRPTARGAVELWRLGTRYQPLVDSLVEEMFSPPEEEKVYADSQLIWYLVTKYGWSRRKAEALVERGADHGTE